MTEAPVKKCPRCGKNTVKRLISKGAGILFKGSGFYQTDYRSKGYSESAKKDAPAAPAKDSSLGKGGGETPAKKDKK